MYRIGIDLGGTNIAVGVVDDRHRIVAEASLPAGAHRRCARNRSAHSAARPAAKTHRGERNAARSRAQPVRKAGR